jgi:hypothetical protein
MSGLPFASTVLARCSTRLAGPALYCTGSKAKFPALSPQPEKHENLGKVLDYQKFYHRPLTHTLPLQSHKKNKKTMTGTLLHDDKAPVGVAVSCLFDGTATTTTTTGTTHSHSISSSSTSNSLLILDQRDLLGGTKEDHSGTYFKTNDNNKQQPFIQPTPKQHDGRPPLVLMKLPSGLTLEELCGISTSLSSSSSSSTVDENSTQKSCPPSATPVVHFLANGTSSTLICHNTSFQMSTIGTSNALILVPPPPPRLVSAATLPEKPQQDDRHDPKEADSPFAKRRKTTSTSSTSTTDITTSSSYMTCPARLVHLGGSGASFMELTRKPLPTALAVWDACRRIAAAGSSSSFLLSRVASDLQYSLLEILQVIRSDLPQVVVWNKVDEEKENHDDDEVDTFEKGGATTGPTTTYNTPSRPKNHHLKQDRHPSLSWWWYYQLLEEDQLLDGQAAVLSTLCESESCSNHEETGGTVVLDQVLPDLVRRLQEDTEAAILHKRSGIRNPYEKTKEPATTMTTKTDDENYRRLARHFLNLLQTTHHVSKEKDDGRVITLDPHKVRHVNGLDCGAAGGGGVRAL